MLKKFKPAFAVHMKKARVLSYPLSAQRRLWSDWADAQADLSLRWAQGHFVGFVMPRLISGNKQTLYISLWTQEKPRNPFILSGHFYPAEIDGSFVN